MSIHKELPESLVLSMAIDAGLEAERISIILDFASRIQRAAGQATEPVASTAQAGNMTGLSNGPIVRAAGQVIPEPVAAHIVQVGEQICHYKTCVRERCRAEERCLDAASLNQPSPLVKAEALALLSEPTCIECDGLVEWRCPACKIRSLRYFDGLDNAFTAEFDLLPEDAKPLCDTFYRSLRKRLGHPVEAAIERPAAAVIRGVRVEGDKVIISVKGGNDAARWLCGELVSMIDTHQSSTFGTHT